MTDHCLQNFVGNPVQLATKSIPRPKNLTKILYIGRFENEQKNLDMLLNATRILPPKGWQLTLIGDGPYRRVIQQRIRELGHQDRITVLGWHNDPWSLVDEASVLVLTSNYEGFGLVLVEALSRGIPVIATACTGPEDIIQSHQNGWILPVGDVSGLTNVLMTAISGDLTLPSPDFCRSSVQHFHPKIVVGNVIRSLEMMRAHHHRS